MCGVICSSVTIAVGAVLVVGSCILSFVILPDLIQNLIINEVVLIDDTIQMERFQELPFALNFTVRIFNLSNTDQVLNGGVPIMTEVGPYTYKLHQTREIMDLDEETVTYRIWQRFEFDPVLSYPNTEDDMVNIVNVPYHAIIQVAESSFPYLLSVLNLALGGVFGVYNSPIATFKVRELLFDGLRICENQDIITNIACSIIADIGGTTQNLEVLPDGSIAFSVLGYKEKYPSEEYKVYRGTEDSAVLGQIISYNSSSHFRYWVDESDDEVSVCNMINGTDSGIYAPFVDRNEKLFAINTDICRSVELRFQDDSEYAGIPTLRYSANEWLLDNDDGCFCLNDTRGITAEDGCLLKGAMELYSCVGAFLVLSYPHFLYADDTYRDGVIGMRPVEETHKIFIDIEPNTGTPVQGAKRAQFNIFMRPVSGIRLTQSLRTALVPFLWVEEGILLPDEFVDQLTNELLSNLRLVDIIIPVLITLCAFVLLLGIIFLIRFKYMKSNVPPVFTNSVSVDG